jgi:hypothetical protein
LAPLGAHSFPEERNVPLPFQPLNQLGMNDRRQLAFADHVQVQLDLSVMFVVCALLKWWSTVIALPVNRMWLVQFILALFPQSLASPKPRGSVPPLKYIMIFPIKVLTTSPKEDRNLFYRSTPFDGSNKGAALYC